MASEFTLTPSALPKIEPVRADRSAVEVFRDDAKDLQKAVAARRQQFVEEVSKAHGLNRGKLVIEKDTDSGRFVHKLINPVNGEVVHQWPNDEWLEFARNMGAPSGLWLNQTA